MSNTKSKATSTAKPTGKATAKTTTKPAAQEMYGGPHYPVPYPLLPQVGVSTEFKGGCLTVKITGDEYAMLLEDFESNGTDLSALFADFVWERIDGYVFSDFIECKQEALRAAAKRRDAKAAKTQKMELAGATAV